VADDKYRIHASFSSIIRALGPANGTLDESLVVDAIAPMLPLLRSRPNRRWNVKRGKDTRCELVRRLPPPRDSTGRRIRASPLYATCSAMRCRVQQPDRYSAPSTTFAISNRAFFPYRPLIAPYRAGIFTHWTGLFLSSGDTSIVCRAANKRARGLILLEFR